MEIKGTAVISVKEFVRQKFSSRFNEWLNSLSEPARAIMKDLILTGKWYSMQDALIEPTKKVCDLFYGGDIKGAWEAGRFSADHALNGVYKVLMRVGSPGFVLARASTILPTYYNSSKMKTITNEPKSSILQITKFPEINEYLENRIGGWIERALEISGCKNITVEITKSLTKGDPVTEYVCRWK